MDILDLSTPLDEVLEFVTSSPTLDQILAFKLSEPLEERLHELLDQNRNDQLTIEERAELDEFLRMGHFLRMMKLKARLKLAGKAA